MYNIFKRKKFFYTLNLLPLSSFVNIRRIMVSAKQQRATSIADHQRAAFKVLCDKLMF